MAGRIGAGSTFTVAMALVAAAGCTSSAHHPAASAASTSSRPATPTARTSTPTQHATPTGTEHPGPATKIVTARPVSRTGTVEPGWTVQVAAKPVLTCGRANLWSGVTVDPGVASCGPDSSFWVACWPARDTRHAYCMKDPFTHVLVEIALSAPFPATAGMPPRHVPYGAVLGDGTQCVLRTSTTGIVTPGTLVGHPTWSATYLCGFDYGYALWSRGTDPFDESGRIWTTHYTDVFGRSPVRTVTVSSAYFVGFAS